MMDLRIAAPTLSRSNFSFSPGGVHGACLAGNGEGTVQIESWSLAGEPQARLASTGRDETPDIQVAPLDDGRILTCRSIAPGRCAITLLTGPDGDGDVTEQPVGEVDRLGLRLLAVPPARHFGTGRGRHQSPGFGLAERGICAIAIGTDRQGRSTIWRVEAAGVGTGTTGMTPIAELPGLLAGGTWLDTTGRLIAFSHARHGRVRTITVDLACGSYAPLHNGPDGADYRLLLTEPRCGIMVVISGTARRHRIGWGPLDRSAPVRFPETLRLAGTTVRPLAIDPTQGRVALQLDRGVRSYLAIYHTADDRLEQVDIPPGCIGGTAYFAGDRLHFPYTAPSLPVGLATVALGTNRRWSLTGSAPAPTGDGWVEAHLERFPGAEGPVEAIVYSRGDWRDNPQVVLALHGGPAACWQLDFDPMLQRLATAGIAVVAPNQRGSTGYDDAHAQILHGAWGGPDLADIQAIAAGVTAQRRTEQADRLMLFGTSYGAYLALLATAADPGLWSRCAVVAPFLSGNRLYEEAFPHVRAMIDQLGGRTELDDELGPRDLWRLADRIRARLLIAHGDADDVVPVTQSRQLAARLRAAGRRPGTDFTYLEIPDAGHDPLSEGGAHGLSERITTFLRTGSS